MAGRRSSFLNQNLQFFYSSLNWLPEIPLISFRIPKGVIQSNGGKDLHHFIRCRSARFRSYPVFIPGYCEVPELIHIDQRAFWSGMRCTPFFNCFFRPEEQHRRSSVYDVIPPMCYWNCEVSEIV